MSFGHPATSRGDGSRNGSRSTGVAQYCPRPMSANSTSGSSRRSSPASVGSSDTTRWEMSLDEFKRQVQNQFTVVLSWDEVRALQKLYGDPDSGTIDFMKFAVALGKSPGYGPDKTRRTYNFLPKHDMEYDLNAIEKKIVHKLEDRCEVAGNYQHQWARRMLCDSTSTTAGGMNKDQLKLRLSGLLGVELSDGEVDVLFRKYADPVSGRVHMQSMTARLLAPDREGGWFFLDNQLREPVVTNRISPSARYHNRPGIEKYRPMDNVFPKCLKGFKWDLEKLVTKLKVKLHEHAQGIAGYQFLAGCNLFRNELQERKGDQISAKEFRRVVEYKFGMKLDPDEALSLFHFLVPGTGDSIEIAEMVRVLVPNDYTDSWFSTRESTDMFGFQKAAPEKIVLQAKKMNVSGSWNLSLIEEKIREKIHERVGGTGVYEVQAAYGLFLDGRNTGLTKKGFKAQMHDKFSVVLSDKDVDDVFKKYDPKRTGSLDVHNFVLKIVSPEAQPEPWFRDRATYEFHVLNRAPMKKDPMKAECWDRARWTFHQFETTLRDKLMAKSNQDGGSFAHKSAVNLLRSANPDHLDSSNFDREAMKFVIFRRFDIVMDENLLDEVFARFDPEGTGKVSVHRLVCHLLPSTHDGSHHLVPKTDEQGQATKTLLGKIFGMTGKRREIINLNGSGVEDPQARSLLERMAAGDKGNSEKIRMSLQRKARAATTPAAANAAAQRDAAGINPAKNTTASTVAAERRRESSPLAFSGDAPPPGTTTKHNLPMSGSSNNKDMPDKTSLHTHTQRNGSNGGRPETTSSTSSSADSEDPGGRVGHSRTLGQGVIQRGNRGSASGWNNQEECSSPRERGGDGLGQEARKDMLREREMQLEERENEIRKREDAVLRAEVLRNTEVDAGVSSPRRTGATVRAPASRPTVAGAEGVTPGNAVIRNSKRPALPPRPEQAWRGHTESELLRREEVRPGSPRSTLGSVRSGGSIATLGGRRQRPQSARSDRSRTLSLERRAEEGAALMARCKALHAARRKATAAAAVAAVRAGGGGVETMATQHQHTSQASTAENAALLKRQQGRPQRPLSRCSVGGGNPRLVRRPTSACSATRPRLACEGRRVDDDSTCSHRHDLGHDNKYRDNQNTGVVAHEGERKATLESGCSIEVGGVVAHRGRTPARPQSAVNVRRRGDRPGARPRSASTSRSSGARGDQEAGRRENGERLLDAEGKGMATKEKNDGEGAGEAGEEERHPSKDCQGSATSRGSAGGICRPSAEGDARTGRYRQRLNSAYAIQMRAMQRLQIRKTRNSAKASPERPASGGCQGIAAGQFRSRHSGLDRFVLTCGAEGGGSSGLLGGASRSSRFGEGVAFFG